MTNIYFARKNKIVSQPQDVTNVSNEYYANVIKTISKEHDTIETTLGTHKDHGAIKYITEHTTTNKTSSLFIKMMFLRSC